MARSRHFGRALSLALVTTLPGVAQGALRIEQPARIMPSGSWSAEFAAFAFSDPIPLNGLLKHWEGGLSTSASPKVYGSWGSRIDAALGPWNCSTWDLTTVLGELSPDGAKLLWLTKQKRPLPIGETFQAGLSIDALHRTGVSVGRAWRVGNLTLGADLRWWTATGAQFGTIQGLASATGTKTYTFDFNVNYIYNQNRLYNLPVPSERGWGQGLSLGASWSGEDWEWQAAARDIGNQTRWAHLPVTLASALSNRSHVDASGYTLFDPSIEGWEGERPYTVREPIAWKTVLTKQFGGIKALVQLEKVGPISLSTIEAAFSPLPGLQTTLGYEARNHLWALGWAYGGAWLQVGASSLSWYRTKGLQVATGIKGRW